MTSTDNRTANWLKLVRYAARNAGVAVGKRDAVIREAHHAGASLREIAAESGLSHMTIKRILDRQPA